MARAITEKELIELETRFWQAFKDRDVDTALKLTDLPCIVTGPQGVGAIGRKEFEEMMKSGPALTSFKLKEGARMRTVGDDVAILAYEVHEELTVDGKPVSLEAADCSTWVRRDDRWVCASHTEAIEGDPYGRAEAGAGQAASAAASQAASAEAYLGSYD